MVTRRELLKAGATTGLMALLPSVSLVASAAAAARPRIGASGAGLTRSTFSDTLFDDFRVVTPVQALVDLRLVEIRDLPSAGAGAEDAFLLRFNAPPSTALGQGTYGLAHSRLGVIDLFLVPMAGGELPAYEAIINRQTAPADLRPSPLGRQLGLRLRPQS